MTDYSDTARTLVYLLSCAVNEKKCDLKAEEIDCDKLYSLSESHGLCAVVAFALDSAGIEDRRFTQAKLKAKRKLGLFDIERAELYKKLNEADIWYLPLKGIVLKDCYPRYGMREMTDNDILCDNSRMADIRRIMTELGYSCEHYGERHHDIYQKPPTLQFEIHHSLFYDKDSPVAAEYYADVFERLIHKAGCEYAFTAEDFYVYMLAHIYKHFSHNGTGMRALLDIYVYLNTHPELDFDYIGRELNKLQISEFEQRSRSLALNLFSLRPLNEQDAALLPQFLCSSLYGSVRQGEYNHLTRELDGKDTKATKAKYLFSRVFISGDYLEQNYPFFAKHKVLLPVLYIYRPIKGLLKNRIAIIHQVANVVKYRSPKNRL